MKSVIPTHHVPIMRDPMSASATKDIRETEEHVQVQAHFAYCSRIHWI